jgi:hypothetical protein
VAFLNWRFGLTQMSAWRIEVALLPGLSNVATPTKAIITIPITLYGYGNGDNAEERGSRQTARWAGACLFSYILKAEPDGYSDGLCRACTIYAPAASSYERRSLLRP